MDLSWRLLAGPLLSEPGGSGVSGGLLSMTQLTFTKSLESENAHPPLISDPSQRQPPHHCPSPTPSIPSSLSGRPLRHGRTTSPQRSQEGPGWLPTQGPKGQRSFPVLSGTSHSGEAGYRATCQYEDTHAAPRTGPPNTSPTSLPHKSILSADSGRPGLGWGGQWECLGMPLSPVGDECALTPRGGDALKTPIRSS